MSQPNRTTPDYDIVVWGATGYTGRLVVDYLAAQAPPELRWAVAGRDRARLEKLRAGASSAAGLVVADAGDPASLDTLVGRTRVVLSTVGPYALYGTPLVEACVRHGRAYCDITAEIQWIRRNVDDRHERAVASGARIVHCCGFDSIPSDLGVFLLHEELARTGRRLARARFYVRKIRGGFSGGTVASLLNLVEEASRDRELRRLLADPYSLNPAGERNGPDGRDPTGARFDAAIGRWTTPFVMAPINTRVVRRSNALLGYPYGRDFRYGESVLAKGRMSAMSQSALLGAFLLGGSIAPTRAVMRRFLPRPGEGPSAESRRRGFFEILLSGEARAETGPDAVVRATVAGNLDPGYAMTAIMLAESALCLAIDDLPPAGGILTPASAMGRPLLDRLRRAGMTFEIVS